MKELYFPTGNEYVSIPTLREETAAIESFSCLHMGAKGLVEFRGDGSAPVMAPFVRSGGASLPLTDMVWQRLEYWVPEFTARRRRPECARDHPCPRGRARVHIPAER